jgi:hypothetical protein
VGEPRATVVSRLRSTRAFGENASPEQVVAASRVTVTEPHHVHVSFRSRLVT